MPFVIGQQADPAPGSIAFPCSFIQEVCLSQAAAPLVNLLCCGVEVRAGPGQRIDPRGAPRPVLCLLLFTRPQAQAWALGPVQNGSMSGFLEDEAKQPSFRCRD